MYKVLLADDEMLDLEGMRSFIPWYDLGLEVVGAVNNGFAACDVMEKESIDILVTDVRMPNMTGLELAEKAIQRQKHVRVIFVSGHQDFNYVKQALTLNACSYVLKPMDDSELVNALVKAKQELDTDRKRLETELAYRHMIPLVKNEYMLRLLEGSLDPSGLEVLTRDHGFAGLHWPLRVVIIEVDDFTLRLRSYAEKEMQQLLDDFFRLVMSLCGKHGIEHICKMTKLRTAVLMPEEQCLQTVQKLLGRTREHFPFTITAGAGKAVNALAGLELSSRQAQEALDYKMFGGKGRLIEYEDMGKDDIDDVRSLDIQLDSLFTSMANYELVRIHDELLTLFKLASRIRSKFTIHNFTMYIIMKLDGYLHTMNEDLFQMLDLELAHLDILLQFETIDDIHSWLRRRVFEISEMLDRKKKSRNWKLIREIMQTVKERLHENITLRDLSDQYFFSPNYLGLLFKEETGKNFSEYVIALRMEKASELLKNTNLKIYEVADRVGYRYLPYFSRQFKEVYGMTPLEYRRQH